MVCKLHILSCPNFGPLEPNAYVVGVNWTRETLRCLLKRKDIDNSELVGEFLEFNTHPSI